MHSEVTFHWQEPRYVTNYRVGVSLHGHTDRSKEGLQFIAQYAARHPLLQRALGQQMRKSKRQSLITVDFLKAYWRPPLSPEAAFDLERRQIEHTLGLGSLISLTDHDNIEAPLELRREAGASGPPISVEWSVPYRETKLHLGVHNLCWRTAESRMAELAEFTNNPEPAKLRELLGRLDSDPEVLLILNHPLWDLQEIGEKRYLSLLDEYLQEFGCYMHAFELGALRSWEENRQVILLAERWQKPVLGGGDRHGAEPSGVLNLTNTATFSEFVREVRERRLARVLFLPQYAQPLSLRLLQTLLDAVREYPLNPSHRRRWDQRAFHPGRGGNDQPLAELWRKPPAFIDLFFALVALLELPPIRRAVATFCSKPNPERYVRAGRSLELAAD